MKEFLQQLLADDRPDSPPVVDLCLDWSLVKDILGERFVYLDGLESFPDLESFSIQGHALKSTKGLPSFSQLRSLNLSQNEISDLTAFPALPSLHFLDLSLNELTQLQHFSDLPLLQELHLSHNQLTSLHNLPPLPRLEALHLTGNRQLQGRLPSASLPLLNRLFAKDCPLHPRELHGLPVLEKAYLTPAAADFTQALAGLDHLLELALYLKRMSGEFNLPALAGLAELTLVGGPYLSAIQGWEQLPALTHLTLRGMAPDMDLSGLTKAVQLQNVELQDVPGMDWKLLEGLPNLQGIGLRGQVNAGNLQSFQAVRKEVVVTFR